MLRYRVTNSEAKRVENTLPVGLARDFPKQKDAWREVDKLGLLRKINEGPCPARIRFDSLAEFYLQADFGADAVRPKSDNTTKTTRHFVHDYLIPAGAMRLPRTSTLSSYSAGSSHSTRTPGSPGRPSRKSGVS